MPARIRYAHGARACEALLLHDIDVLCRGGANDPGLLRTPIRIVVPSASLREHLAARIVTHAGRAVAGVIVHTLHGLARFVLDAGGRRLPRGAQLFPLLVRQVARGEPSLASLHELADGCAALVGTVADLLDAGFEEAHADAIEEMLQQLPHATAVRVRVGAVVRIAQQTLAAMRAHGIARQSEAFTLAREIVAADSAQLRARAVLVHGFADATGVASDFICSLLGCADARIYLDQPYDPAASAVSVAGAGFIQRFSERVSGLGHVDDIDDVPLLPDITLLRGRGANGEIRAIADRIRLLLDAGIAPEHIGVVARDLAMYRIPIRQHFGRLGIPFSAIDARAPFGPVQRRIAALLALLQQREAAPAERWVEALGNRDGLESMATWRADLRLALHTLNVARVGDVAALAAAGPESAPSSASRQVAHARRVLAQLGIAEPAAALLRRLTTWPSQASFAVHSVHCVALVRQSLWWSPSAIDDLLAPTLRRLGEEVPGHLRLSFEDFLALIGEELGHVGAADLGGSGAGVRILDVTAARSVTFAHLFIAGLNRDAFPRTIIEDPLVPDAIRRALGALLPDLPIKQLGFDEERYLFAQLLSASPTLTLSWQFAADDGRAASPSPLVERLRLRHAHLAVETVPGLYTPPPRERAPTVALSATIAPTARRARRSGKTATSSHTDLPLFAGLVAKPVAPRPAHEHVVLAGLHGSHASTNAALHVALPSLAVRTVSPAEAARAQCAIIDEHEGRAVGLGPYHGIVGAPDFPADPRRQKLYVTTMEGVARCPWRTFVRKVLGVQPPPDALESLPAVTALVLGNIVHRVLDRIVREAIANAPHLLAASSAAAAHPLSWPSDATVERLLQEEATALVEESGIAVPGLVALMFRHARAYLAQAKRSDWPHAGATVDVIGSEMTGAVEIERDNGPSTIYFTADRVDAVDGALRLTDYKTGRPMRDSLLVSVANGTSLQCVAYALGAGHLRDQGRYLYLRPNADDARRSVAVPAADTDLARAFHNAAGIVLDVWERGVFFPRFAEPNRTDFGDCRVCEVHDACLRNDSEYRARFLRWMDQTDASDDAGSGIVRTVRRGWRMRAKPGRGADTSVENNE